MIVGCKYLLCIRMQCVTIINAIAEIIAESMFKKWSNGRLSLSLLGSVPVPSGLSGEVR